MARDGGQETAEVLTPLIRQFEAGKLRFRRSGPRRRDPNHWEIVEVRNGVPLKRHSTNIAQWGSCPSPSAFDCPYGEGVVTRNLLQEVEPSRRAAMAGLKVGLEQDRGLACSPVAQPRDPLAWLRVGDPRVRQPTGGQDRRIGVGLHLLVGRIALDQVVSGLIL